MAENLPDTNVGNIEYIRKKDAVDAIHCDITITGRENAEIVCKTIKSFTDGIKALEPADVVPVVHGKWLPTNDENKKRCNKCDTVILIAMYPMGNANFCPNCGARMERSERDGR